MAISIVLLLGLAITFYGYVSIHWFGVIRSQRQADVRSSRILQAVSADPTERRPSAKFQQGVSYGSGSEAAHRRSSRSDVIVMTPSNAGKHQKQVVA
jgi:hypothetical protein